jgi:ribosome-associated toxin RatA of RatAB toxin-antitoxin module
MTTHNEIRIEATPASCFKVAADVERWPEILSHYRWVRFHRRESFGCGLVEMAARRVFGPFGYPVWWMSEMWADEDTPVIRYRHVEGITKGMDVEWRFRDDEVGTRVEIVHEWAGGPGWPLISRVAADRVIGPVFIHHVGGMTLEGVKKAVEAS